MEPKFQSSFIPKGPAASAGVPVGGGPKVRERNLFSFIASIIFVSSIILALGVFGYKFYLKYSIDGMESDLQSVYSTLEPESIGELIDLDNRIVSAGELIARHIVISPLFEFLEESTPTQVRFIGFNYILTDRGYELTMTGEARSYADLALQSSIFKDSEYFRDSIFSDFVLSDNGNITFSFKTMIDPGLLSYRNEVQSSVAPIVQENPLGVVATSTATTATSTATSTNAN